MRAYHYQPTSGSKSLPRKGVTKRENPKQNTEHKTKQKNNRGTLNKTSRNQPQTMNSRSKRNAVTHQKSEATAHPSDITKNSQYPRKIHQPNQTEGDSRLARSKRAKDCKLKPRPLQKPPILVKIKSQPKCSPLVEGAQARTQ
jgi:hypothetical protein